MPGLPLTKPIEVEAAPMPESIKQQMQVQMKKVAGNGRKTKIY
jgi:capsule polysaccharide export protein KpsE/RkpR